MSPRPHLPAARAPATSGKAAAAGSDAAHGFPAAFVAAALADALAIRAPAGHARVYAISGLQGSGKSTLAAQLAAAAQARGLRTAVLSIDDFYLGRRERLHLGRQVHPLLATRGPPGTHDAALACALIEDLRHGAAVRLPRFDKLADTRLPPSRWPRAHGVDLVVLEGWFLGAPAQDPAQLAEPVNALERDEDAHGVWRDYCNRALAADYPPLWARLDRLLFLQPPGFEVVAGWRWQQEQALQARHPRRQGMTRTQVQRFVSLFERVSRQALARLPGIADRTVVLDAQRRPQA
ncbi:D-glycerate 3-kinase [Lysobacter sp. yr284]|uniref:kinase n=1 Tax=Lysobacter sp. yr284 TaxID=1761791 RepID=UPI00089B627E|nr:kinase [Lysobacter sp. yr284]SDY71707.1 D-glycerate 3-kinase [Lysobacter sp. yr284]